LEKPGSSDLESAFFRLNVWRRGGERAPHKPLLVLYALGRCARGEPRLIPFREVDERVRELLVEFGPARRSQHPELPFFHLQSDGVWEIQPGEPAAGGGILPGPKRPSSLHEDIAAAVGLDLEAETVPAVAAGTAAAGVAARPTARNPVFREQVMRAYEYRCAVCGFQGRLGHALVGLDAAHIKWHQAGGPDETVNGLALCALQHKLFDRGVFTLTGTLKIQVSEHANGGGIFDHLVLDFNGQEIHLPQRRNYHPEDEYVDWHAREVFQGPGRWLPVDDGGAGRSRGTELPPGPARAAVTVRRRGTRPPPLQQASDSKHQRSKSGLRARAGIPNEKACVLGYTDV
jgi:putative restriction endonuclease